MSASKHEILKVKSWLLEYREEGKDVDLQNERLERFKSRLESYGSQAISDMPRAPSPVLDKMSGLVALKLELEDRLDNAVKKQLETNRRIEYVVSKLPIAYERNVIRLRYIDDLSWCDVAETLFGGEPEYEEREVSFLRRIYKIHNSALENIADYMRDSGDPEVEFFKSYIINQLLVAYE